jgi:hypothetical protein
MPSIANVPHELVEHVSWLVHARKCERGMRWRKLGCFHQALLVSTATAWRYVDETLEVPASWAPGLQEALVGLGEGDFVIVDGTLISTDRAAADQPYYSQKHRKHGMNVQVIARPDGTPL